jgi:hypothetical protein
MIRETRLVSRRGSAIGTAVRSQRRRRNPHPHLILNPGHGVRKIRRCLGKSPWRSRRQIVERDRAERVDARDERAEPIRGHGRAGLTWRSVYRRSSDAPRRPIAISEAGSIPAGGRLQPSSAYWLGIILDDLSASSPKVKTSRAARCSTPDRRLWRPSAAPHASRSVRQRHRWKSAQGQALLACVFVAVKDGPGPHIIRRHPQRQPGCTSSK